MAHVNVVKCMEISKEKIYVNFDEAHVNVVNNNILITDDTFVNWNSHVSFDPITKNTHYVKIY